MYWWSKSVSVNLRRSLNRFVLWRLVLLIFMIFCLVLLSLRSGDERKLLKM